jgi:hypothetical protein
MPTWQDCESVDLSSMFSITSCRAARTAGRSLYRWFPTCISRCSTARGRCGNARHRRPERRAFCGVRQDASCQRRRRDDDALGRGFAGPTARRSRTAAALVDPACSGRQEGEAAQGEDGQSLLGDLAGAGKRVLGIGRLAAMLLLESVKLTKNAISLPFVADGNTPLTGQVTAGRQFATASVSMVRVKDSQPDAVDAEPCRADLPGRRLAPLSARRGRRPEKADHHPDAGQPAQGRGGGTGNKIGIIQVELSPPPTTPMSACATSVFRCAMCAR